MSEPNLSLDSMEIDPPQGHQQRPASATPVDQLASAPPLDTQTTLVQEDSSPQAGPSTLPFYVMGNTNKDRKEPPHLRMRLHPTQDLISRLGLLPAFNELVRPYIRIPEDEKGKGKEKEIDPTAADGVQPTQEGEKKKEHDKGWKSFATAVTGKYSVKKDTYLGDLVSYPPRPRLPIVQFDDSTLNGFRLEEGQLEPAVLQQLGLGPDDKKKHKKKAKKLAEGQGDGAASSPNPKGNAIPNPIPTPSSSQTPRPVHPGYANGSPFPNQNRPPQPQPQADGGGSGGGLNGLNPWHGQIAPAAAIPSVSNKALKVRKEPDGGSMGVSMQSQNSNAVRPHKKRKTDAQSPATSSGASPHGLGHPHQQQQPMQQATPTF